MESMAAKLKRASTYFSPSTPARPEKSASRKSSRSKLKQQQRQAQYDTEVPAVPSQRVLDHMEWQAASQPRREGQTSGTRLGKSESAKQPHPPAAPGRHEVGRKSTAGRPSVEKRPSHDRSAELGSYYRSILHQDASIGKEAGGKPAKDSGEQRERQMNSRYQRSLTPESSRSESDYAGAARDSPSHSRAALAKIFPSFAVPTMVPLLAPLRCPPSVCPLRRFPLRMIAQTSFAARTPPRCHHPQTPPPGGQGIAGNERGRATQARIPHGLFHGSHPGHYSPLPKDVIRAGPSSIDTMVTLNLPLASPATDTWADAYASDAVWEDDWQDAHLTPISASPPPLPPPLQRPAPLIITLHPHHHKSSPQRSAARFTIQQF
ncbi:hypothetical protein N0V88_002746 [Collariella sp. IMI 366227]|nr:hypothetical protein N0V88_002746 [Collariella sp. IMI 366227]